MNKREAEKKAKQLYGSRAFVVIAQDGAKGYTSGYYACSWNHWHVAWLG